MNNSKINSEDDIFSLINKNTKEMHKITNEINEIRMNQEKNKDKDIIEKSNKEESNKPQKVEEKNAEEKNNPQIIQTKPNEVKVKTNQEKQKEKPKEEHKRKVIFNEEENLIIKFDKDDYSKRIKVYNLEEKEIPHQVQDLKNLITKLKKKQKLKCIIKSNSSNESPRNKKKENIEQKMALSKLTELIDECDEKSSGSGSGKKETKPFSNLIRNNSEKRYKMKALPNNSTSKNKSIKFKSKDKDKNKINYYNNFISIEDIKEEKKNNIKKRNLFAEKIKQKNLNKIKKKLESNSISPFKEINNKDIIEKKVDLKKVTHAINNLKRYFETEYKEE